MSRGVRSGMSAATVAGFNFLLFQEPEENDLRAVEAYIKSLVPEKSPWLVDGNLSEKARRGKVIFERRKTNDGRLIERKNRCVSCHFPPLYTDRRKHVVGKKGWLDRDDVFDTPHLLNIYDSAPYLHNGIAHSLEEIWTRYNPEDRHGQTNDMTKDQLNDLVEYLKTL